MKDALRYYNPDNGLVKGINPEDYIKNFKIDKEHKKITDHILSTVKKSKNGELGEYVLRAASLRGFLG